MDPNAVPASIHSATLADYLHPLGIFGPFFFLLTIALIAGLFLLFFKTRPLCDYVAYLASTLYPLLLGFLGGTIAAFHYLRVLGDNGIADPGFSEPAMLANALAEIWLRLICGSLLTCLFFPLGILALFIRKPK